MVEWGQWFFENHAIYWIRKISYYFLAVNFFYMFLLVLASVAVRRRRILKPFWNQVNAFDNAPSISILAPAYNEALSIENSIQALCHLKYPNYEVIVINDGSKDNTLEKLKNKFRLYDSLLPRWSQLSVSTPQGIYRSKVFPNLIVIDKSNTGKADSLNVGIDFSSSELVCCVDSDSLLEVDSLAAIAAPFVEDPSTIASGGTVRVINGNKVELARVIERNFPKDYLSRIQFLEYIRAFFCGRVGWNALNSTLIISGAFGVFKKSSVVEVGGYHTDTLGEDMDLVIRLHAHNRKLRRKYRIEFLPEPVCWTEVPTDWSTFKKQRQRWAIGLFQVLLKSKRLFFNPRYGSIGFIALPYFLLVDLLSPFFEFIAIFMILWGVAFGYFTSFDEITLFFTSVFYGSVVTFAGAMIDDSYDERRRKHPSLFMIFLFTILENFGYRQIHSWWRIQGFFKAFKKTHVWGDMVRKGIPNDSPTSNN